jgi:hypothetical protein
MFGRSATLFMVAWLGRLGHAAFGLTSKGNSYSVDTGGGLVFDVSK